MKRYPEIGERVRVQEVDLPPSLKEHTTGEVIDRNGEYIYIELDNCQVVIERYPNEIEPESIH